MKSYEDRMITRTVMGTRRLKDKKENLCAKRKGSWTSMQFCCRYWQEVF